MIDAKIQTVALKQFNIINCSEAMPDFIFNYGVQTTNGTRLGIGVLRFPEDQPIGASIDLTQQQSVNVDQTVTGLFFRVIEVDLDLGESGLGSNILAGWQLSTFQAKEDDALSQQALSLGPNEKGFVQEVRYRVATGELGPLSGSEFNVDIVFDVHYSRVEYDSFGVVDGDLQIFLSGNTTEPATRIILDRLQPDFIVSTRPGQRRVLNYILTSKNLGISLREVTLLKNLTRTGVTLCDGVPSVRNGQLVTAIETGLIHRELVLQTISILNPDYFQISRWIESDVKRITMNASGPIWRQSDPQVWAGRISAIILERFEPRPL